MDTIHSSNRGDSAGSGGGPSGVLIMMNYDGQTGSHLPIFDQIHINDMNVKNSPYALRVSGLSNDKVTNVTVSNSTCTNIANQTSLISNANVTFTNTTINGKTTH